MQGEEYTHTLQSENGAGCVSSEFKCKEREIRTACEGKMGEKWIYRDILTDCEVKWVKSVFKYKERDILTDCKVKMVETWI